MMNKTINRMAIECYSKKTIQSYKKYCNEFVGFAEGDLNQNHILPYLSYLAEKNYSPSSINVARSALLYFFNKVLNKPITIVIPKPRIKAREPNPVSRKHIKMITEIESDIEKRTLIELACGSGLRRAEIVELKWGHIDFDSDKIRVVLGKGRKDRIVPLAQVTKRHLLDLRQKKTNSYVFPNKKRQDKDWHISYNTPLTWVKAAAEKAGIDVNIITHALRASFITHSIENGVPEKYMQKLAGHSSRQTTDRYEAVADYRLAVVRSPLDELEKGLKIDRELKEKALLATKKVSNH